MVQPKRYCHDLPFSGEVESAMEWAKVALLGQGFQILSQDDGVVSAVGPGMRSPQQPPLRGVSEVRLTIGSDRVSIDAILGGVSQLKLALLLLPFAVGLLLVLMLWLTGSGRQWDGVWLAALWLVVFPIFSLWLEKRTTNALDSLLRTVGRVGESGGQLEP